MKQATVLVAPAVRGPDEAPDTRPLSAPALPHGKRLVIRMGHGGRVVAFERLTKGCWKRYKGESRRSEGSPY